MFKKSLHSHIGLVVIIILALIVGGLWYYTTVENNGVSRSDVPEIANSETEGVTDFESCTQAEGAVILESYPEQCRYKDKTFINESQKAERPKQFDSSQWTEVSLSGGLSFNVADGWNVLIQDGVVVYADEGESSIAYDEGSAATIDKVAGGRDGVFRFLATVDDGETAVRSFEGFEEVGEFKTDSGLSGTKYYDFQEEESDGLGPEAGTAKYAYYIRMDSGRRAYFSYSIFPGDKNRLELVESVIKTARATSED